MGTQILPSPSNQLMAMKETAALHHQRNKSAAIQTLNSAADKLEEQAAILRASASAIGAWLDSPVANLDVDEFVRKIYEEQKLLADGGSRINVLGHLSTRKGVFALDDGRIIKTKDAANAVEFERVAGSARVMSAEEIAESFDFI